MSGAEPWRAERPKDDVPQAMRSMVDVWQSMALASSDIAHAKRQIFLAYVAEGFTESQALELIKSL